MYSAKSFLKKSLVFILSTLFAYGLIMFVELSNQWLVSYMPDISIGILPIAYAIFFAFIGFVMWIKFKEEDSLKDEFISMITHKFRTPLTQIKWASENLHASKLEGDQIEQVKYIQISNERLIELSDLMVAVSDTKKDGLHYRYEDMDLSLIAKEIISTVLGQIDSKKVKIEAHLSDNMDARIDTPRIRFIMQTFVENAIHYGGSEPVIQVSCSKKDRHVMFSVTDNGIGVTKDEQSFLFERFYRGDLARSVDTDGMGIALYMSRRIIGKHKGKIGVESKGRNTGSTFYFSLPASK